MAKHHSTELFLGGLISLTETAAGALAKHEGQLYLQGDLSDFADAAAQNNLGDMYRDGTGVPQDDPRR